MEDLEKVGAEEHLTRIVTDRVKIEEMVRGQNEERLCKSIIKGLARRNHEKHAILAEMVEENQNVVCIDDVTGKELPWHEVREAQN